MNTAFESCSSAEARSFFTRLNTKQLRRKSSAMAPGGQLILKSHTGIPICKGCDCMDMEQQNLEPATLEYNKVAQWHRSLTGV